jgi:hypothetical protein
MSRILGALAALGLLVAPARDAGADVTTAARAYAEGQAAQLARDHERAAQSFELAYSIVPSKEALRSAIRNRQLAGHRVRAATLAETLLASYGDDPQSVKLAREVIDKARPSLGRVRVTCAPACSLAIDGRALSLAPAEVHVFYATPGRPSLEASFAEGGAVTRRIETTAGATLEVKMDRPPALAAPARQAAPRDAGGVSPVVPIIGAGITVALAGVAIWSGLDTQAAYDDYVANPTHEAFEDGQALELRTNILWGATAAVGVGTAAVALFWTRWHAPRAAEAQTPKVTVAPAIGGGHVGLGLSGRF